MNCLNELGMAWNAFLTSSFYFFAHVLRCNRILWTVKIATNPLPHSKLYSWKQVIASPESLRLRKMTTLRYPGVIFRKFIFAMQSHTSIDAPFCDISFFVCSLEIRHIDEFDPFDQLKFGFPFIRFSFLLGLLSHRCDIHRGSEGQSHGIGIQIRRLPYQQG